MARRKIVGVVFAFAVAFQAVPALAAETVDPAAVEPRSLAARSALGLSTDPQLVRQLAHDPKAVLRSLDTYGIPLTAREKRSLDRRTRLLLG